MKIQKYIEKDPKKIFIYVLISSIFLFFAYGIYKNYIAPQCLQRSFTVHNFKLDKSINGENKEFTQIFNSSYTDIAGFNVQFDNFNRENFGSVVVKMVNLDANETIFSEELDMKSINYNEPTFFNLQKTFRFPTKTKLAISIKFNPINDENSIGIYLRSKNGDGELKNTDNLYVSNDVFEDKLAVDVFGSTYSFYKIVYTIVICCLFSLFTVFYFVKIKNIEIKFAILSLSLGMLFSFMLPMYSAPDEGTHFKNAYYYSNVLMSAESKVDEFGNVVARNKDLVLPTTKVYPNSETYKYVFENIDYSAGGIGSFNVAPGKGLLLSYLPQAVGISIARVFDLNFVPLFFLGRTMNLIFYTMCCYFAIKLIPFAKMLLFTIALFPMSLELAASYSYDPIVNGLAFLFIAFILKMKYDNEPYKTKDYIILCLLMGIMAPIKVVYVLLAFLTFLLPFDKAKDKKKHLIGIICILTVGFLVLGVSQLSRILTTVNTNNVEMTEQVYYSIGYLISNPIKTVNIAFKTLENYLTPYLLYLIGSYLGWVEIPISIIYLIGFIIILFFSILQFEDKKYVLDFKDKMIMLLVFGAVFGAICLALLISYTPIGFHTVYGVQGRYFLPVFPLLCLTFTSSSISLKKDISSTLTYSITILNAFVILEIISFTFIR